ncbi:MAG: sporulation integral membrane protein YtvI [Oscillospiraceae bacterium]
MKGSDNRRLINTLLRAALIIAGVLIFAKFLLPCLLPFIFAFLTAWLIEPAVRYLNRRLHFNRGAAAALCVLFILLSFLGLFSFVISRLIYEAVDFVKALPELAAGIPGILRKIENSVANFIARSPDGIQEYLDNAIDGFISKAAEIPAALSSKALTWLSGFAGSTPRVVLFCATYAIGSFFISSSFPEILRFIKKQIPESFHKTAHNIKADLLSGLGRWLKAQLTLMCITFLELTLALMLLKINYAVIIAFIIAVIDALPVFGTGVVLIPWAVILFISGDTALAVGLLATYLIVTVARSCLEPKIVGAQFGISPAAALLAMYSGYKLIGVAGMILFPFLLMMLKQMNDKGYVKLWK